MIRYAQNHQPDNVQTMTLFSNLPPDLEVFLCTGYTDLRKSIDGLIGIVEDDYGLNARSKTFYCFCGRRAEEYGIRSIAFPAISTGKNGFPLETAAKLAVRAPIHVLSGDNDRFDRIVFVMPSEEFCLIYNNARNKHYGHFDYLWK